MAQTRFTGPVLSDAGFILHNLGGTDGSLSWNSAVGTADLTMPGGVTQQIGLEQFMQAENLTASTMTNGMVAGFAGVNSMIRMRPYVADGSVPSLYVMGILTQDVLAGEVGYVTTFGEIHDLNTTGTPVGEVWSAGDILYANPARPGMMTNVKPTSPSAVVVMAAVTHVSATAGIIFVRPTITLQMNSGDFSVSTNLPVSVINTAYTIGFSSTESTVGVSVGTPSSRIVVSSSGLYRLSCSLQISSASASAKTLRAWYRKNGVDVSNTARLVSIQINSGYTELQVDDTISLAASDYIEVCYAGDSTDLALNAVAATSYSPSAPSVRLSVNQIQL